MLEVSEDEDKDDGIDNEYESLHPELEGWDNGVSSNRRFSRLPGGRRKQVRREKNAS
jgi:hypothetical protein